MATIDDRVFNANFSGLKSTAITSGCFILGGLVLKEVLQRLRRYPDEDRRRKEGEAVPDRGMDGWAMGYLYRARTYVAGPKTPDYPDYPLSWVVDAWKRDEKFFETHCGPDATVYVRFLRGTLFWVTLHLLTTFPILLSINFIYAPSSISTNSIDRASLTSLVKSGSRGLRLLPIHVVFVWLLVLTWVGNLVWIGYGALRIRRNELRRLLRDAVERHQPDTEKRTREDEGEEGGISPELDPHIQRHDLGWRYRTVLVRNIPPILRREEAIKGYFEQLLGQDPVPVPGCPEDHEEVDLEAAEVRTPTSATPALEMRERNKEKVASPSSSPPDSPAGPRIVEIVLVRRHAELNALWTRYGDVLHALETAHVELARNVMEWVKERVEAEEAEQKGEKRERTMRERLGRKKPGVDVEADAREGDDLLLFTLRPFLPSSSSSPPLSPSGAPLSLWSALHTLHAQHPSLLDRFQPLYRLRYFRRQSVPSIDYHLTKLNLLLTLIEDKRASSEREQASSTAFVTFEKASDARRARKELAWRPIKRIYRGRVLDTRVTAAPEFRDLHWDRLILVSLSSDLLRGTILQIAIWAVTLVWVIPISFLIGLLSLDSLTQHLPGLAAWLERNSVARSLFTSLLPTALYAIINMFVPFLLGIAQRKGRTLITESKWSMQTQQVYWKFVVVNLLIVFTIGRTAFDAFLNAFKQPTSVLPVVAAAFPKAASFFVSYVMLQAGIHTGIELSLLGISFINHASIRKYIAPRKRALEAEPRFFGWHSWVPNHLFIIALMLVFAVLNPLVIAFGFLYFVLSVLVMKQQFSHVYYRRQFEGGGRIVFRRVFRYSLDIAILAEVVYVAFFFVGKHYADGAACIPLIPLTVLTKLIGTRWFDHLIDELEEAKINIICDAGDTSSFADLSVPLEEEDRDLHYLTLPELASTIKTFATVTLPALALHPAKKLPRVASPSKLAAHWKARSESAAVAKKRARSRTSSFNTAAAAMAAGSAAARPRAHTSPNERRSGETDDWGRPMLETIMSREESAPGEGADGGLGRMSPSLSQDRYGNWAAASDEGHGEKHDGGEAARPNPHAQPVVPSGADQPLAEEALKPSFVTTAAATLDEPADPDGLISPHPPIIRDDRPVSHLHYHNPALVAPLSRSLWLPRDPLKPVDLGDTVDYSGRAVLVSSEGGRGVIGSWEEMPTCVETAVEEGQAEQHGEALPAGEHDEVHERRSNDFLVPSSPPPTTSPIQLARRGSRLSVVSVTGDGAYTLKGNERIRVAADVAQKIEAEEGQRQLSVLDVDGGGMQRRASYTSSSLGRRPSSILSGLQRRGTRVSSAPSDRPSSLMVHSPHHSPVLVRHPDEAKPSPPAIPSFTDEPAPLDAPSSTPPEGTAYPFPPTSPSPAALTPSRIPLPPSPIPPSSPTSTRYPPLSPASPSFPGRRPTSASSSHGIRTRTLRSASLAPSLQFSVALGSTTEENAHEILVHPDLDGGNGQPAVSLSQAAALRAELLQEERAKHLQHEEAERQRLEKEEKDRAGGASWLRRLLVKTDVDGEVDET
ncbi:hypothetical protein JCM8097_005929 [Rhodosporidiobolus ruineniae]